LEMGLNELCARLTFRANLNLPEVMWVFPVYKSNTKKKLLPILGQIWTSPAVGLHF